MDILNRSKRIKPLNGKLEEIDFLVVDDERLMQTMVRQMLRDNGAGSLRVAESASEAFRMLRAKPAQVIITDWHMPGMTGIELLQAIKGDPDLFRTQVMLLSSETSPLGLMLAFEEGVDGFVLKPFNEKGLLVALLKLLGKRTGSSKRKLDEITKLKLLGRYKEAIDLGEQLLIEFEGDEDGAAGLNQILAECHYAEGNVEEALKKAQAVNDKKNDSKSLSLMGRVYLENGNYEQAIEVLQQAADQNPLNMSRRIELAAAFIKAGKVGEFKNMANALDLNKLTDMNLVGLASCYLMCGEAEQAATLLRMSRDPLPSAAKVFNACGAALWKKKVGEESIKLYKRAIKIDPDYSNAHYNLGLAYCFLESYDEAKGSLECAIRLKPDYMPAKELLGYIYQKQNIRPPAA